jgi:hypothetical protein
VEHFTLRNTTIMALAQIAVIVAGVLGAGATHKWYATFGLRPPPFTALFSEYGFLALVLPVAWAALALQALWQGEKVEAFRWLAVSSGALLMLLLLLGSWYAAASPLLRLIGSFN